MVNAEFSKGARCIVGSSIYSILQGIQLEVGHNLIDHFHCIMHPCQSKKKKLQLLFSSTFYVMREMLHAQEEMHDE